MVTGNFRDPNREYQARIREMITHTVALFELPVIEVKQTTEVFAHKVSV